MLKEQERSFQKRENRSMKLAKITKSQLQRFFITIILLLTHKISYAVQIDTRFDSPGGPTADVDKARVYIKPADNESGGLRLRKC